MEVMIELRDSKKLLKIAIALFIISVILDSVSTYVALSQKSEYIKETNYLAVEYIEKYGLVDGLINLEVDTWFSYLFSIAMASYIFAAMCKKILTTKFKEMITIYSIFGLTWFSLLKIAASLGNFVFAIIIYIRK